MVRSGVVRAAWLYALFLVIFAVPLSHAESRHQQWTQLLGRHVENGVVDYQGFKQREAELDSYLSLLGAADPGLLTERDRLAYYINAYNAYTVKLILNHFKNGRPPASIRKVGGLFKSPWDIQFALLGGNTYSLDNIEHDIIRKQFVEPRIHFALNCASKSCPKLISEAYEGDTLNEQLQKSTRSFLEDPAHNNLTGEVLHVSSIFKWYREDFPHGPLLFFIENVTGDFKKALIAGGDEIVVRHLDYDWSLNSRQP